MANIKKAAVACGLIGALAIGATAPSFAQFVIIAPHGPYYGGPYGHYAGPYGYRGSRYWDYPAGYDSSGAPYYHNQLGWHRWGRLAPILAIRACARKTAARRGCRART